MADERTVRDGVREILSGAAKIATLSETTIDDTVIAAAQQAVANDLLWGWIYRALQMLLDDKQIVGSALASEITDEADEVGFDPATIIAIITAIVQLIKLFRNR